MRQINKIIIHCAATPNGRWHTVNDIDRWHAERGFKRQPSWRKQQGKDLAAIGYHYVIYTTGAVVACRAEGEVGAHCQGHNADSIGVCLVGTDKFTPAQWDSLAANIKNLLKKHPKALVHGHRHHAKKLCPGFDVAAWLAAGMKPLPAQVLAVSK